MSDIDFDELDRAVASVLTSPDEDQPAEPVIVRNEPPVSTPSEEPVAEESVPVVAPDTTDTPDVDDTSEPVAVSTPTAKVGTSAQALHTTAKPVQRGRFFDMVHPSQDMRPRSGAPISPVPRPVPAAANQTFVSDVVAPQPTSAPTPEPMIQPLISDPTPEPETPVVSEPTPEPTDFFAASPDDSNPHDGPETPVVSPFIPDAKVEKRPLGAFSGQSDAPAASTLPMGDQLHQELVQVESEDNVIETAESPIPVTPKPEVKKDEKRASIGTHTFAAATIPAAVSAPAPVSTPVTAPKPFETFEKHEKPEKPAKAPKPEKIKPLPKPHVDKAPKYGKGTLIWVTVAIAVMLIGFGVGATLYFVVLR